LEASSREQVAAQDQELVRLRVAVREHARALKEMGEDLAAKDKAIGLAEEHARSLQAVGEEAQASLVERLRLAEEQIRALQAAGEETERAARTERADKDRVLAAKDEQIARFRLKDEEQRGVLREREEELAARDEELERAAKKQRKTVDNATRSYAQLGAHLGGQCNSRLVQVKQVPARGSSSLIATDRTPSLLK
jgi:hypothetical protein